MIKSYFWAYLYNHHTNENEKNTLDASIIA
jgi:hypothetical protein